MAGFSAEVEEVFETVGQSRFEHINEFVEVLETLRNLREKYAHKRAKYINTESLIALEEELETRMLNSLADVWTSFWRKKPYNPIRIS